MGDLPEVPSVYEKWRASTLGRITDGIERNLILELIGEIRGRTVLDIGCGDGELAVALSTRDAKVTGIDASTQMIEAARERAGRYGADVAFEIAHAGDLPFARSTFDVIVAVTVLCFVENPELVVREAARLLRPGGRLVIGELGRWNAWAAMRRIRGWLGNPTWHKAHFWSRSLSE